MHKQFQNYSERVLVYKLLILTYIFILTPPSKSHFQPILISGGYETMKLSFGAGAVHHHYEIFTNTIHQIYLAILHFMSIH